MSNPSKLLVLIQGNGVVRAGQWARRLIINQDLKSGTQIPFITRAMEVGALQKLLIGFHSICLILWSLISKGLFHLFIEWDECVECTAGKSMKDIRKGIYFKDVGIFIFSRSQKAEQTVKPLVSDGYIFLVVKIKCQLTDKQIKCDFTIIRLVVPQWFTWQDAWPVFVLRQNSLFPSVWQSIYPTRGLNRVVSNSIFAVHSHNFGA